jgi:hypothetical protein
MKRLTVTLILVSAAISSCSTRNYHEGLRLQQEMECEKQPAADRDECIKRADRNYDEYQRQRKEDQHFTQ